jgi:hypothetical protein
MDFYAASILIDRQVEAYLNMLEKDKQMTANYVRDLRYYVSMLIGKKWDLATKTTQSVASAMKEVIKPIPTEQLKKATEAVKKVYEDLGATDKKC